jgi:protein required for attachment to host cells
MRKARIWVLIADSTTARICSSADGTTLVVPANPYAEPMSFEASTEDADLAWRVWQRSNTHGLMGNAAGQFAAHLGQILNEGAREQAYDGFMVIAAPEIARSLERALSPEAATLLIGEIVRDVHRAPAQEPNCGLALYN